MHDAHPMHDSHPAESYLDLGVDGRIPVSYVGPPPYRRHDDALPGRRPVVAILDTGCGEHWWLDGIVAKDVKLGGDLIGYDDPTSAPDLGTGDVTGPIDGVIDPISGHGTFIAGLVHQACPDADIISWRIVPSDGPIAQSDLLVALHQIAELAKRYREGTSKQPIDVLNLSMGYYHEQPQDAITFDPLMTDILTTLAENGVVVVASAGNDSTDRPCFPAAFSTSPGALPVVAVGALNPNGTTDALFSNVGHWVTDYARGAAVFSTMPTTFTGGLEPVARWHYLDRPREALDPDDYKGGFGLWSGTSFAAPVVAGRIAAQLIEHLEQRGHVDDTSTAVAKAHEAVQASRAAATR